MPATLRSFDDTPLPASTVVDSSFLFEALIDPRDGDDRHARCQKFAQALRDSGTTLVWSPLVFLEAPQCWRKLYRKGALPAEPTSANDTIVQADAFADATAQLRRFLGGYETYEVLLTDDVLDLAARQAGQYNLKSHDSVSVAITSTAGVYDVVALDGKFRRVEHVTLWQP